MFHVRMIFFLPNFIASLIFHRKKRSVSLYAKRLLLETNVAKWHFLEEALRRNEYDKVKKFVGIYLLIGGSYYWRFLHNWYKAPLTRKVRFTKNISALVEMRQWSLFSFKCDIYRCLCSIHFYKRSEIINRTLLVKSPPRAWLSTSQQLKQENFVSYREIETFSFTTKKAKFKIYVRVGLHILSYLSLICSGKDMGFKLKRV